MCNGAAKQVSAGVAHKFQLKVSTCNGAFFYSNFDGFRGIPVDRDKLIVYKLA